MADEPRELTLHELNEQARAAARSIREQDEEVKRAMADAAATVLGARDVKARNVQKPARPPVTQ